MKKQYEHIKTGIIVTETDTNYIADDIVGLYLSKETVENWPNEWKQLNNIICKTVKGENIRLGDTVYFLQDKNSENIHNMVCSEFCVEQIENYIKFLSLEDAEKYLENNYKYYSLNDIKAAYQDSITLDEILNKLKQLNNK